MASEDGVDEGALAESCLTCSSILVSMWIACIQDVMHTDADNIELEPSFEKLLLNLIRDTVKSHVAFGKHGLRWLRGHCASRHLLLCAYIGFSW